jgi:biopolymer transport protein ExbB/TolQ
MSVVETLLMQFFLFVGAKWILWLLIVLSVILVAIVVERAVFFARNSADFARLSARINDLMASGDLETFRADVEKFRGVEAVVLTRSLQSLDRGRESVEEVMDGVLSLERKRMERGLTFLGTVGANAPFIGLLGTVLGIIRAFRDLSSAIGAAQGASAVMAGLSEALVATAAGLFVAIPAVVAFNYFQRHIKSVVTNSASMNRFVLSQIRGQRS